jgi:protein-S-isoprenylcysteine O-methyltransferase Ste14
MYASELLMFAALVLHLHALFAAGLLVLVGLALAWRITAEERALGALGGHAEYTARVRHRLIPGVW